MRVSRLGFLHRAATTKPSPPPATTLPASPLPSLRSSRVAPARAAPEDPSKSEKGTPRRCPPWPLPPPTPAAVVAPGPSKAEGRGACRPPWSIGAEKRHGWPRLETQTGGAAGQGDVEEPVATEALRVGGCFASCGQLKTTKARGAVCRRVCGLDLGQVGPDLSMRAAQLRAGSGSGWPGSVGDGAAIPNTRVGSVPPVR